VRRLPAARLAAETGRLARASAMANVKFSEPRAALAVSAMKLVGNLTSAAEAAGVSRQTIYNWLSAGRADDAEPALAQFAADFTEASHKFEADLVTALRRNALGGDTKAAAWLLEHGTSRWSAKQQLEHSGPEGGPIEIDVTPESAAALVRQKFGEHAAKSDPGETPSGSG